MTDEHARPGRATRWLWVGAGLLVFALGAAFLRHHTQPDTPSYIVVGGAPPAPGEPLALRVKSRMATSQEARPVVFGEAPGARPADTQTTGADPLLVHTTTPAGPLRLALWAPRPALLELTPPNTPAPPAPATPDLPPTPRGAYHLDLLPEAGALIAGLDNRVFVRLLDAARAPLADQRVTLTHPRLPGGGLAVTTDRAGLASVTLKADLPNHLLTVDVGRGVPSKIELFPEGRELLVTTSTPVVRPGEVLVNVATRRTRGRLFCELLAPRPGGAPWREAFVRELGPPTLELRVRLPAPGRYDLQCALSEQSPGLATSTLALFASEQPPRAALGLPADATELALAWRATTLRPPWRPPIVWLDTRAADLAALITQWQRARAALVIALGCVLLGLLAAAVIAVTTHLARRRRALERALDEAPDPHDAPLDLRERRALIRTRGWLLLLVGLALLGGNVAAIASLLMRIG